ncbi:MAG: AbrB/MazE/SpoVT family DNA-binding domain-containing protein [Thermoproteales archaeon]|nr:AbrB/MazE/SpoVT family DNA-binding domain-containing protein [Thermoproteales archaeon]RLE64691.1 MAG: AbrB/MazE/SpoVT family DNA-binding domain-containing protein [Thermoprotei archaeon]
MGRRGVKGLPINKLPYKVSVYINGQVLIPAQLIRKLKLENYNYANISIEYKGNRIQIKHARLNRTYLTASRQFTIPKNIREKYGIKGGDQVTVFKIEPIRG